MKKVICFSLSLIFMVALTANASAQEMKKVAVKPFNDGLKESNAGNYKDALVNFEKALTFDKDYRIYYQIGFAQMKLNDPDDAIKSFKNSIAANPKFDDAYNNLGNVYYNQGNYQDAINNFEKVLTTSSSNSMKTAVKFNLALAYTELANASENNKNYKEAIGYLKKAVEYNNYDEAYFLMARNYVEAAQYKDALQAAEKALKYRTKISETGPDYYIGIAYSQLGEMSKAKIYLNKAKKDPTYASSAETVIKAIDKQ